MNKLWEALVKKGAKSGSSFYTKKILSLGGTVADADHLVSIGYMTKLIVAWDEEGDEERYPPKEYEEILEEYGFLPDPFFGSGARHPEDMIAPVWKLTKKGAAAIKAKNDPYTYSVTIAQDGIQEDKVISANEFKELNRKICKHIDEILSDSECHELELKLSFAKTPFLPVVNFGSSNSQCQIDNDSVESNEGDQA